MKRVLRKVERVLKEKTAREIPLVIVVHDGQEWHPSEEEKRRAVEEARREGRRVAVLYAPEPEGGNGP
ncbi:hypothetical protein TthHB5008_12360 [Thermus thermophilus]|uniref:hypothetical protein n=1 Tax=Thermus thermophilus TaxID=274 RepID=UPI00194F2F4A|nr:hypothetical protein [Thermus thermophilus]BCP98135.1 hypothetical protein TthHB5002_12380 [Thermus thermophilus]BCQ00466.1 hypothetical protein TthHB5008_12360 [Thermus thermophilus]